MSEQTLPEPIELSEADLRAVSGGHKVTVVGVGISQSISQDAAIIQSGGSVFVSGHGLKLGEAVFVDQAFVGVITQVATNVNTGNVVAKVSAH